MKTNEHHREFNERLRIVLHYQREIDLDPGKSIEFHYRWIHEWMRSAVLGIEEENGNQ